MGGVVTGAVKPVAENNVALKHDTDHAVSGERGIGSGAALHFCT